MLLLIFILSTVFIFEMALGFIPYNVHFLSRTLRLKVWYEDGVTERKKIKIRKGDTKYRITGEDNAYLQQENGRIYIYSPYKERLFPKTYNLEVKVRFKRLKPRFLFTFMLVSVYFFVLIFGKIYVKKELVPAFAENAYPLTLTHKNSEYIDFEAYDETKNYLIVGSDAREDMNTPHADVILLVSFNKKDKKVNICSLLRDLYVDIKDSSIMTVDDLDPSLPNYEFLAKNVPSSQWKKTKLNYAVNIQNLSDGETHTDQEYYAAGLNSLVDTIEYNYKMPITGVINISWAEFIKIIDALGGVDINITEDMLQNKVEDGHAYGLIPVLDSQNAIYSLNDSFDMSPGRQHLNGNKALAFVRLGYVYGSSNSDVERTERIREFCISLIKQKNTDLFKLLTPESVKNVSQGIYSSLSEDDMCELVDLLSQLPSLENKATLPYDYHNYVTDDNQLCIAVDGRNEDRLDIQAKEVLCK